MGKIVDIFLPLALAFIMLSLGLGLTKKDFLRVFRQPKDFFVGLFCQVILLPLVGFLLVKTWSLSPELAIGVMLIAIAPGGVTSNIFTLYAKGDVALSISLTAVISLLSTFTVPFILLLSLQGLGVNVDIKDISLSTLALSMFLIVTVPVLVGMLLKHLLKEKVDWFYNFSRRASLILFIIVILGAIIAEKNNIVNYFAQAGLVTFTLNIIMMILAIIIGRLASSGIEQRRCLALECGLQNGTLAIVVGNTLFGGGVYVIPVAIYSLIMFATSLAFVFLVRQRS